MSDNGRSPGVAGVAILAAAAAMLLSAAPVSGAAAAAAAGGAKTLVDEEIKTKGYVNGKAIMQFVRNGGGLYATQFISGVIEGMAAIGGGAKIGEIYPGCRREDVIRAVDEYYAKNPSKQHRPVVDVILSGCK
jgi:hypothetical protein